MKQEIIAPEFEMAVKSEKGESPRIEGDLAWVGVLALLASATLWFLVFWKLILPFWRG